MTVDGTWQRAALPLTLLGCLNRGALHGYALARTLEDEGFGTVKGATLYPALSRLEADGLVVATWTQGEGGPGRKVFELTPAGHEELARLRAAWTHLDAVGRTVAQIPVPGTARTVTAPATHGTGALDA